VAQVAEGLPSKYEALSSNPRTVKKKKKKKRKISGKITKYLKLNSVLINNPRINEEIPRETREKKEFLPYARKALYH
jgi:hypothetical protein